MCTKRTAYNLGWYNQNMDRKSKILFTTMFILIVVSVSATFYKSVILQDFVMVTHDETEESTEDVLMSE